tara:strand:+ start:1645 stop:2886 length:1242 start_codon:yes stop_codon:yes gene_type:complete
MSIVTTSELNTHLGQSSTPARGQACLDAAEASIAAYLEIHLNHDGDALAQHTISERITPVRDRAYLEVSGGAVTGIESIVYDVKGFHQTRDEKDDDSATETPSFDYVFNPNYSGWTVSGRDKDGDQFIFQKGITYRVTYRVGWCAGNSAYAWEWFRTGSGDTWDDSADRLGWGFVDGTATTTNAAGAYLFGPQPSSSLEGIHYETGGSVTDERLQSPVISVVGSSYRFVEANVRLIEESSTGYPTFSVGWLDGDGRTYYTGKKRSSDVTNFLPDRLRASSVNANHTGYTTLVADMGFNPSSTIDEQNESPVRGWLDQTITRISLDLWNGGASDPNGAVFLLDWVRISDGTTVLPKSVRFAILETARAMLSGGGSGVMSERIGDYSKTMAPGEATQAIPANARGLLDPFKRASW